MLSTEIKSRPQCHSDQNLENSFLTDEIKKKHTHRKQICENRLQSCTFEYIYNIIHLPQLKAKSKSTIHLCSEPFIESSTG